MPTSEGGAIQAMPMPSPTWDTWQVGTGSAAGRGLLVGRLSPAARFQQDGHAPAAHLDGGRAYAAWGADCVHHLNGAFALAWWDGATLVLGRDRFGQVPLFWSRVGSCVVFSSVLADFLTLPGAPPAADERAVRLRSVGALETVAERSALEGVHRVFPGSVTEIGESGHVCRTPTALVDLVHEAKERTYPDTVARLEAAIRTAIDDCVDPREVTSAHLSAGIDSTTVAVLANRSLRVRGSAGLAFAYSWTPPADEAVAGGESGAARTIAEREGIPLWQSPDGDPFDVAERPAWMPRTMLRRELPVLDHARRHGVSVLLSGWGGDEFASFGGRHYVENLLRRGAYLAAMRQAWREAGVRAAQRQAPGVLGAARRVAGTARHAGAAWRRSRGDGPVRPPDPDPVDRARYEAALSHWRAASARDIMRVMEQWGHLAHRIEEWCQEARSHGVEYRYPLLDLRVVEVALETPEHHWTHDGVHRAPIKDIAATAVDPVWAASAAKREPELDAARARAARSRTPAP